MMVLRSKLVKYKEAYVDKWRNRINFDNDMSQSVLRMANRLSQETPLIIVGMHRSGTSLLSELMQLGGFDMGSRQNIHSEARRFVDINERVFRIAHADWDNPEAVRFVLKQEVLREKLVHYMLRELCGPRLPAAEANVARAWGIHSKPWGWKDPRTTYTLPLWLDIFPKAKVVNIVRNGIDTANSLKVREWKRRNLESNELFSARCLELDGAFELWAEYNQFITAFLGEGERDYLTIRYEDLLEDQGAVMDEVEAFVGHPVAQGSMQKELNKSRSYSFKNDPQLAEFYQGVCEHPMMKKYGYKGVV